MTLNNILMVDKRKLHKMTTKKKILEKHSKHHSAKHMKQMKTDMKKGDSFKKAHTKALKKVGK